MSDTKLQFDMTYNLKEDAFILKRAIAHWEALHDAVQRLMADINKHYDLEIASKDAPRINIEHRRLLMADLYRKIGEREIL